ncbi:hypothetical protein P171DRAFT_525702 [Karstenula rhodostoma CBS 690.94]|uniref:C3H1-type domain-containing protein n=1 Tax=Karstenula rhodostoma CBS 690.94 TaxID=1392251 RepID=A0A9P4P812_9PLEO|nr:hypothetical protein P171DRAFT_525702 [Karstenula rhodostoma CBS 690.94]
MSTNSRASQQSRYPMRERKRTRHKEVYHPDQDAPKTSHSAREERKRSCESSPLSSVRSDVGSMDVRMRSGSDHADIHYASVGDGVSTARDDRSTGVGDMDGKNERRDEARGRIMATSGASLEAMSLGDGHRGLNSGANNLREYTSNRPSHHHPQRPRSASPRRAEQTSYRSRSPLSAAPNPHPHTAHEIEEEIARIDREAADFEAEYQRLLLEQSIQKRNYFKAKVEEQRRRMAVYTDSTQTSLANPSSPSTQEPLSAIDNGALHPSRRARMERASPSSPARSATEDNLKDFNPPVGPRGGFARTHISPLESHNALPPSPELSIRGTAASVPVQPPNPPLSLSEVSPSLNDFQRRILATLSKGYAPRTVPIPTPPRTLRYTIARTLGNDRLFCENYGGSTQEDLALCKWVFDTEKECPAGKDCTCRHEPLDDEELEWIRTNPVPVKKNIEWHPGKWLERLLQNYSSPRMPKVSRFDRGERVTVVGLGGRGE